MSNEISFGLLPSASPSCAVQASSVVGGFMSALTTISQSRSSSVASVQPKKQTSLARSNDQSNFKGDHLFVHHDAQHMKARPNRRQVFSHVQGRYKPWKRREKNKELKDSARIPRDLVEVVYESLSPRSLLAEGNSDPFGMLPITIGARENELIAFYRDVFVPAQYEVNFHIPNISALRASDWEDCRTALQNEDIAHGLIARFGHAMSGRTSSFHVTTLEHQHKSTSSLLRKVQRGQVGEDFDSYFHINMLFSAETLARNLQGSLAHGKILRHMFEESWKKKTMDYKLLLYQLYNDCQLSSMFLVRPIWDVKDWLPEVWAPVWDAAAPHLPDFDDNNATLDPSLRGLLASHIKAVRYQWTVLRQPEFSTDPAAGAMIMAWFLSNAYLYHGRLMNLYLDITQLLRNLRLSTTKRRKLLVLQYTTLAAIYHKRVLCFDPKVFGTPLFDARPSLLSALQASLEAIFKLSDNIHRADDANARLWALYVGAMSEHANASPSYNPHAQWFNSHLAKQAMAMRIRRWDEALPILQGFIYYETIAPDGKLWFERTLEARRERLLQGGDVVEPTVISLPERLSPTNGKISIPRLSPASR